MLCLNKILPLTFSPFTLHTHYLTLKTHVHPPHTHTLGHTYACTHTHTLSCTYTTHTHTHTHTLSLAHHTHTHTHTLAHTPHTHTSSSSHPSLCSMMLHTLKKNHFQQQQNQNGMPRITESTVFPCSSSCRADLHLTLKRASLKRCRMLGPIMMLVWAWLWATHHRNTSTPYAGSFFLSLGEARNNP